MKTYLQKHNKIKYSDHWSTPKEIYEYYVIKNKYYDPCPLNEKDFDFREIKGGIFLNPPYSDITTWIEWAIENQKKNYFHDYFDTMVRHYYETVILIPSRTDTKYFHKLLEYGCELEFIKGRLKFGNHKGSAHFPSVLVHLRGRI